MHEWKKEKAVLEQQNELLQLQIQELREREENYKKFNDTILNAYMSLQSDSSKQNSQVYKEIQLTLEQYSKELIETKNKNTILMVTLENENRQLKNTVSSLEQKISQLTQQIQSFTLQSQRYSYVDDGTKQSNKENENKQEPFLSDSSEEDKKNVSTQSGCIVTAKGGKMKHKRSKTQLAKQPLSISNLMNCKNSNVMEIHNLDFFKMDSTASPTGSLNGLLKQFQKRDDEIENVSPQRITLTKQLKQLTKDLKDAKVAIPQDYTTGQNTASQLKHEIKFMINKLLKAKGKMSESYIGRSSCTRKSQYEENKSLAEFSRHINAVRSIENLQLALKTKNKF